MTHDHALIPTAKTAIVMFLDLQEEIVKNNRTCPTLAVCAGALAKLAALYGLPVIASSVPPGGAYLPDVLQACPQTPVMPRTFTSALEDNATVEALARTGRRSLILSGVATEIVVQRTALEAIAHGYTVYVAVDACGGVSARTEQAAWNRIVQAGGITTSVTTFAAELAGNFTSEIGGQTLGIMYETLGAG
jgi:nicotinamidase-related amidase